MEIMDDSTINIDNTSIEAMYEEEIEALDATVKQKIHDLTIQCVLEHWTIQTWKLRCGKLLAKHLDKPHRSALAEYIYEEFIPKKSS